MDVHMPLAKAHLNIICHPYSRKERVQCLHGYCCSCAFDVLYTHTLRCSQIFTCKWSKLRKFPKLCIKSPASPILLVLNFTSPLASKSISKKVLSLRQFSRICSSWESLGFTSTSSGRRKFWLSQMQMRCIRSVIMNTALLVGTLRRDWSSDLRLSSVSGMEYMEKRGSCLVSSKTWNWLLSG